MLQEGDIRVAISLAVTDGINGVPLEDGTEEDMDQVMEVHIQRQEL